MKRSFSLTVAALLWLASAATLLAQANPLEVIPEGTLGFALIKDLSDANEKVGKVTQKMQIPMPDLLTLVKGFVGVEKGLDEKGGLAIALVGGPEGRQWEDSAFFAVVPFTDYKELIAPLSPGDADAAVTTVSVSGMNMVVGKKGSFAVFAFAERKEALEKFLAATKNVTGQIEPLKDWMADKQLALVVTPEGKKLLFQTIGAALPDAEQLNKNAQVEQAAALANVGEMFGMFKELLAAADEQLTHLAVGLHIDDNASLRLAARAIFVPGGKLAAWSKDARLPDEGLLSGVPAGKFAVAYGGVSAQFSKETWDLFNRFSDLGMQTIGLDEEGRKKFQKVSEQVQAGKRFSSGMLGMMRPGDTLFSTALAIEHVKNADDHVKAVRQMFELMASAQKDAKTDEPIYELHDVKVGDLAALEVVTHLGSLAELGNANNAGAEQVQSIFGKLFGGDGTMRMYVAKADQRTVVTAYNKEQLLHTVQHVRSGAKGLEADADLVKTSALLPQEAQWIAYVSPQGLVQWISVFVEAIFGGQIKLPPFPATEPIGLAARVSQSGLDAELVLPESVVAGIGKYVGAVGQIIQGGGAPLP
jgi:hypothetical protein